MSGDLRRPASMQILTERDTGSPAVKDGTTTNDRVIVVNLIPSPEFTRVLK